MRIGADRTEFAVRDPVRTFQQHAADPTLPLSPVSFILALRTMFDAAGAGDWHARIGFRVPDAVFTGTVSDRTFTVTREEPDGADAVFNAAKAPALAAMVYLGKAPSGVGAEVIRDLEVARRFTTLFELPERIG